MDRTKELYFQIQELYKIHGASLPKDVFTEDIYRLLLEFTEEQIKINWLDSVFIWAAANLDRYNGHSFGS